MTTEAGPTFGQLIRDRRRQLNLTQEQVARRIRSSTPYVGHLESGKRHPSNKILPRLADALGFEHRELFLLANPHARSMFAPVRGPENDSAWKEFHCDRQLHELHHISDREMQMLSQVALMGQVRSSRDFIYILNTIRQSLVHSG